MYLRGAQQTTYDYMTILCTYYATQRARNATTSMKHLCHMCPMRYAMSHHVFKGEGRPSIVVLRPRLVYLPNRTVEASDTVL